MPYSLDRDGNLAIAFVALGCHDLVVESTQFLDMATMVSELGKDVCADCVGVLTKPCAAHALKWLAVVMVPPKRLPWRTEMYWWKVDVPWIEGALVRVVS